MHKLILSILIIPILSFAQMPIQKLEETKKQALEKHLAEKERALNDLKTAGIASASFIGIGAAYPICMRGLGLAHTALMSYKIESLGNTPVVLWTFIAWIGIEAGLAGYAIYKGGAGAKHLYYPDNPKPKETIKKEESHA